jgi:hypothetical protein
MLSNSNLKTKLALKDKDYNNLVDAASEYQKAYDTAQNESTRTSLSIKALAEATTKMKATARWARDVFLKPALERGAISETEYEATGFKLRDTTPTPIVINTAPILSDPTTILSFRVRVRFRDENSGKSEAKPAGVNSCVIFYAIGDEQVSDPAQLKETIPVSRSPATLQFSSADAGKWLSMCACWEQARGSKRGPKGPVIYCRIGLT